MEKLQTGDKILGGSYFPIVQIPKFPMKCFLFLQLVVCPFSVYGLRGKQKVLNDRLGTWVEIPKSFGVVLRESLMACWADIPRDCGNQVQTCNYIFNSTRLLILSTGCKRWDPDSQAGTSEQTDVAATSPQDHPTPFVWPSSKPMIRVLF